MANSNEHDYDDLLAQATSPREASQKRLVGGERNILFDSQEENRAKFKIDPRDRSLSGGGNIRNGSLLELDPESFQNEVQQDMARRQKKKLYILLGIFVVAAVFAWGIISIFPQNQIEQTKPNTPTSDVQKFVELYPNAPEANIAQMKLTADGSILKTVVGDKAGWTLNIPSLDFTQVESCKVTGVNEFTRCATTTPDNPSKGVTVWMTKDAVHTSLFAKAQAFQGVDVVGAAAGAVMKLQGFANEERVALVVVAPDVSGYIFILPVDATIEDAKGLAEAITVE